MPYQTSFFQLPGGARCVRLDWSGVATGEQAAELAAAGLPGQPFHGLPMLICAQGLTSVEARARGIFGARSETPLSEFQGIVVTNPIVRVASNFIRRMNKNPRQRLFGTEAAAIQWLDEKLREYAASQAKPSTP